MQENIVIIPAPRCILPQQSRRVRLVYRLIQNHRLVEILPPDVNVRRPGPHGKAGDQAPLDQLVGVLAHYLPVLARAGLGLVGVHHEEARAAVGVLGHEAPLHPGGEAGAPPPTEAGVLDLLHDPIGTHSHDFLRQMVVPSFFGVREAPVLLPVEVREDSVLVTEAGEGGAGQNKNKNENEKEKEKGKRGEGKG